MALKKKKKESTGRPNLILVIFLILFILVSVVLGIFTYSGYSGQWEKLAEMADAKEQADIQRKTANLYKMLYRDARAAVGDEWLTDAEKKEEANEREAFFKGEYKTGIKKDDPAKNEDAKKFMEHFRKELGGDNKGYASSLTKQLASSRKMTEDADAKAVASEAKRERAEKLSKDLLDEQKLANDKSYKKIVKYGDDSLAAVKSNSDEFTKLQGQLKDLKDKEKDKDEAIAKLNEEFEEAKRLHTKEIKKILADQKQVAGQKEAGVGRLGKPGEYGPLMLDISMGKPLWDDPVGKIVRVDLELRQVVINLGSHRGVKPELTFNIFAAAPGGRAEKQMKGTIEVIKVLDTSTSLCRITSLYDIEGKEILLNLDTRTRLTRETEAPIREGDLLFNMFWGTRVAIVGFVGITGEPTDNPAEQIRQMEDFKYLLNRNGIKVDAFVDPRNGQIVGNINSLTNYLIQGVLLAAPEEKPAAPAAPKEGDDKEAPPVKEKPMREGLANSDRIKLLNESSIMLKKDAVDKGLLLISAENFANVIGYRKARAANSFELSTFSPRLPYVTPVDPDAREPRPAPKKDEEKKAMEKDAN